MSYIKNSGNTEGGRESWERNSIDKLDRCPGLQGEFLPW